MDLWIKSSTSPVSGLRGADNLAGNFMCFTVMFYKQDGEESSLWTARGQTKKKMENQQDLDKNIEEKECKIDFIGEVDVGGPGKWWSSS